MEKVFNLEYGVAGVCVLLTIQVLVRVGTFLWEQRQKKDLLSESSIEKLTKTVKELEQTLSELPKLRKDIKRYYTAIKVLAGDKWPAVREEILEEGKIHE